jgi:hypothetical protein
MNDDEMEAVLRRYAPPAPATELRQRILAQAGRPRLVPLRAWDWSLAAATIVLLLAGVATEPDQHTSAPPEDASWSADVQQATQAIADDVWARQVSELLVPRARQAAALPRLTMEPRW